MTKKFAVALLAATILLLSSCTWDDSWWTYISPTESVLSSPVATSQPEPKPTYGFPDWFCALPGSGCK